MARAVHSGSLTIAVGKVSNNRAPPIRQTFVRHESTGSSSLHLPRKCPNHQGVCCFLELTCGGKCIASDIHHFTTHCIARASWRVHRDPFRHQLCVLGTYGRLRPACRQKIVAAQQMRGLGPLWHEEFLHLRPVERHSHLVSDLPAKLSSTKISPSTIRARSSTTFLPIGGTGHA